LYTLGGPYFFYTLLQNGQWWQLPDDKISNIFSRIFYEEMVEKNLFLLFVKNKCKEFARKIKILIKRFENMFFS